ncbi:MAG: hypothetical protein NC305_19215 [Lachnospiraceae bacterium]|nr:hypothetical protein [Lachnospiraceae bacterium]
MAIIKQYQKSTGTTYVYESESYWDKEKKQPRSRRKLIGKLDPETGETIPTGRKRKKSGTENAASLPETDEAVETLRRKLSGLEEENGSLREKISALESQNMRLLDVLGQVRELVSEN